MHLPKISKAKFDKMTKAERRMRVAEDVLALVDSREIRTDHTVYLTVGGDATKPVAHLLAEAESCHACAIGAAYVCSALRFNDKIGSGSHSRTNEREMFEELEDIFTEKQLLQIEIAHECNNHVYAEPGTAAHTFGKDHNDREDRLIAIWQNVLDHNGTFVPSDRYDVTANS